MLTALRRSKSLPTLLVVLVTVAIIATLCALMFESMSTARRGQTADASDASDAGVPAIIGTVGANFSRAVRSGRALPDSRASSSDAVLPPSDVADQQSALAASGADGSDQTDMARGAASAGNTATGPADDGTQAGAPPGSAASSHGAAAHRLRSHAVHRRLAEDPSKSGGTLRADIVQYNTERREGHSAAALQGASMPNVHSLWDAIPGPMSDVYRN